MSELTEAEIELISTDIDQQGLTYTQLKIEMLDHICCSIEEEMERGVTFNEAYRKVKQEVGSKRIRQIQDETLYLINKKYRKMKKIMYGLGIAIPILMAVAVILKLQHWPGAGLLLTLAFTALAVFFLPVFVMVKIRDTRKQNEPVPMTFYITGMIASMLIIIGAMGKIQHMPGGSLLLSLGICGLALVFLPMYISIKFRDAAEKNVSINKSQYILGIIAGILFLAGALFKLNHWPGGGYVMYASWIAVAVILLPLLVLSILKKEGNRLNNFLLVIVAFSTVSLLMLAQVNRTYVNFVEGLLYTERNIFEEAEFLNSKSDVLVEEVILGGQNDTVDLMRSIQSEADKACNLMISLQEDMIKFVEEGNLEPFQNEGKIDFTHVRAKDIDYPSIVIMLRSEEGSEPNATILKSSLESFRDKALSASEDPGLKSYIRSQFGFELDEGIDESWEEKYFDGALIQSVTYLTMFQSTVRLVEYELLKELAGEVDVE